MPIRPFRAALVALALLATACAPNVERETKPAPSPVAITATLPATLMPPPSVSPPPALAPPTAAPVDGVTSTQLNIRAEPSTASEVLGILPAATRIEITGRDPAGNWLQINYPPAAGGKGWVTARYITTASTADVPTIGGPGIDPNAGNVAVTQQQLNVRSGPGTSFNSLGTLNPGDVVSLTGKDPHGAWLQIEFRMGPEGKGWVNAAFVQAHGAENLPIVAESGLVVGTGTPTVIPPTPTPTVVPAPEDGDSPESPIASVIFGPGGTRSFMYNGDVSVPQGDAEDWIAFRPYADHVFLSLECTGSNSIEIQILENRSLANTDMKCGIRMESLAVDAGMDYVIHLKAVPAATALEYVNYILTVNTRP